MRFLFTPEEAQSAAAAVAGWLQESQFRVEIEAPIAEDAPYRTSVMGIRGGFTLLAEAQGNANYGGRLEVFANWLAARRLHCELYLATLAESSVSGRLLKELKRDGVGLLIVEDGDRVETVLRARNPALMVTPDPTLGLGALKSEVSRLVSRFNSGERKDALRDMCEVVERETQKLLLRLVKKGWLNLIEQQVRTMDWSSQINTVSSAKQYHTGRTPPLSPADKDDLQSFRGARNILDHKATSKRAEYVREQQFAERMIQGPRLIALLARLQRKIK
jgi:hypothetical protein